MKIYDVIDNAEWTNDCCGKQDLDFDLFKCSTRYYPDKTAKPSFICYDNAVDDYIEFLTIDDYITGKSEEEVKVKVKQWYKDNLIKAVGIFLDIIKKENNNE